MAWTPADVVDEVRGIHGAFDEQTVPTTALRRAINRYHAELYSRIVDREPYFFTSVEVIEFPLTDFEAGYTLPADFNTPVGGDIHWTNRDGTRRLNLVPFGHRHQPGVVYPAFILRPKIYFIGSKHDWDRVDKVDFHYVPEPVDLVALDTEADLPDRAKRVIVERCAMFAAGRSNSISKEQVQTELAIGDWTDSQEQLLNEIDRSAKATSTTVREVW